MKMPSDVSVKIIASACFVSLFFAFLIAYKSPATGYEYSFYSDTPFLVWILLFCSFLGGIAILVCQALAKKTEETKSWLLAIPILALSTMGILLLPSIRDYVSIVSGDLLSHLGITKDILSTDSISNENFYPISHILVAQLADICHISLDKAMLWSTPLLSITFVLSTYMLSTVVFSQPAPRLLATAVAGALIMVGWMTPNGWSMLIIPLIFFCYFKREERFEYSILLVILLCLYPFFHPLSAVAVAFVMATIEFTRFVLRRSKTSAVINLPRKILRGSVAPIMIIMTILIPWLISFNGFHANIRKIWEQITGGITPDVTGEMSSTLGKIDVQGTDLMILLFRMYGELIIVIGLSGITFYLLLIQIYRKNMNKELGWLLLIMVAFVSIGFIYFLYLAGAPGLGSIAGDRITRYLMVVGPVLCGFALYRMIIGKQGLKKAFTLLLGTGVICLIAVISVLNLYHSPYKFLPNSQVTHMDVAGMKWLSENRNSLTPGQFLLNDVQHRLAIMVMGEAEYEENRNLVTDFPIINHFDYQNWDTLGQQYEIDHYTGYTQKQKNVYSTVWKTVGRFTDDDFRHLDRDPSVNRIYTNGESNYYHVFGCKP